MRTASGPGRTRRHCWTSPTASSRGCTPRSSSGAPLIIDAPDQGPRAGLGDASLGTKIRLINEEKDQAPFPLSIFPAVGIPTGDSGRGLGSGSPSLWLPFEVGRKFLDDKVFVYGDFGYEEQFDRAEADTWRMGIAAEASVLDSLTLCAELRYEHRLRGAPDDALWQVGFKYRLSENVGLMGAAGRASTRDRTRGLICSSTWACS